MSKKKTRLTLTEKARLAKARRKLLEKERLARVESIKTGIKIQSAFLTTMIIGYAIGNAKTRATIRRMFK